MQRWFYLILLTIYSNNTIADGAAYGGRHEIAITQSNGSLHHVHDWSNGSDDRIKDIFFDFSNWGRIFKAENQFSFIEYIDRNGNTHFRVPSPALSRLWFDTRHGCFIGMSNIKHYNPYQLVVWNRKGVVVHKESIRSRVAKFSNKTLKEFKSKFPKADKALSQLYFNYENTIYLNFMFLGTPNLIGKDAWHYLYDINVKHPYISSSETASNFVDWYGEPELSEDEKTIIIQTSQDKSITIPVEKCSSK